MLHAGKAKIASRRPSMALRVRRLLLSIKVDAEQIEFEEGFLVCRRRRWELWACSSWPIGEATTATTLGINILVIVSVSQSQTASLRSRSSRRTPAYPSARTSERRRAARPPFTWSTQVRTAAAERNGDGNGGCVWTARLSNLSSKINGVLRANAQLGVFERALFPSKRFKVARVRRLTLSFCLREGGQMVCTSLPPILHCRDVNV